METRTLTERIIGLRIEVHRLLGPGLPEAACEAALCMELQSRGISFSDSRCSGLYKGSHDLASIVPDLIVADEVIIEVKSVERFAAVHVAQVTDVSADHLFDVGLIMNFNSATMRAGIRRVVFKRLI